MLLKFVEQATAGGWSFVSFHCYNFGNHDNIILITLIKHWKLCMEKLILLFNLKCSTVMMTKQNFTSKHSIRFIHIWCGHFGKILVSTIFVASNFRFLSWSAQPYIDLTSKVLMIYGTESTLQLGMHRMVFFFHFFLYILIAESIFY